MPALGPRSRRSEKSDQAPPPAGRQAPLQRASDGHHGNDGWRVPHSVVVVVVILFLLLFLILFVCCFLFIYFPLVCFVFCLFV